MSSHDIIVIGASAGGQDGLSKLVHDLPAGLPASLFVVCHFPATARSVLPDILSRAGPLLATHARQDEPIHPGHIYVAPPDHHLLLEEGYVKLTRGPRENGHRPAIDPLFRSAAHVYGNRVIGVVLSGALYDGVAGLLAIRAAGGIAIVQDPGDAVVAALPEKAAEVAGADFTVPAADLALLLADLVRGSAVLKGGKSMADPLDKMPQQQIHDQQAQERDERRGNISVYTCPECGGSLWQVDDQKLVRFRCHVGHVYNGEALLAEQAEVLEAALWTAIRTFKDRAVLSSQLAHRERELGDMVAAARFDEQAQLAQRYYESIYQYLLGGDVKSRCKTVADVVT
jgi:two-component system chemotaxis response regulator CheB